jgi:hypothetical protein
MLWNAKIKPEGLRGGRPTEFRGNFAPYSLRSLSPYYEYQRSELHSSSARAALARLVEPASDPCVPNVSTNRKD